MTVVTVIPGGALGRVRPLARALEWDVEAAPDGRELDAFAGDGRSLLVVPPQARVPRTVRRILVPHEGSPVSTRGFEVADRLAVITGAEIVVLHVPTTAAPSERGSFPAPRFTDRPHHDWAEWRREFERRFCHCSEGVRLEVALATGPPGPAIVDGARRFRADLVVMTWKGEAGTDRAPILKMVAREAPCPVLIAGR